MEVLITLLFVGIGLYVLFRYLHAKVGKPQPPGPSGSPFVGSAFQLDPEKIHENFTGLAAKYGDIFQVQIFDSVNVVLNSLDLINKAFSSEKFKDAFNDRPQVYFADQFYFNSQSITYMNLNRYHGNMKKVTVKGLHIYGDGISKFEEIVKNEINRVMVEIQCCGDLGFEVTGTIRRSVCNIMSMLIIGQKATETDAENFMTYAYAEDYFLNPLTNTILCYFPFLRFTPIFKPRFQKATRAKRAILDKYFVNMKSTYEQGTIRGLVDYFIEDQSRDVAEGKEPLMTDERIQANILDFIVAGILTTSAVLPSTILCLITHPDYQIRLQQELDRVIGQDRDPCISDRNNCDFLEAVVMETMRYIPPLPLYLPHVCAKDIEFEGFSVKKNSIVFANTWHVHHNEKIWGDPWIFRPERFLDEHGKLLPSSHNYMKSVIPFGTGRRRCPGESLSKSRMFLYLATFFKTWTFSAVPGKCGSSDPRSDDFHLDIIFKPKPFYCVAKQRF